jgi:hypothetical protein
MIPKFSQPLPTSNTNRVFNNTESAMANAPRCYGNSCVGKTASMMLQNLPVTTPADLTAPKNVVTQSDGSVNLVPVTTAPSVPDNKNFIYNSYSDWRAPNFNQWTRSYDDNCNEENRLKLGSKPMKYYVNEYNSPESVAFMQYTEIGGQKQYNVRNDYERSIPSRLNAPKTVFVLPYSTTPFLGNASENRTYVDTSSNLRFGTTIKNLKSQTGTSEMDYNRWSPGVEAHTVQNAGQFGLKMQQPIDRNGYYDYADQNNVLFMNSATPQFGVSSRNLMHNMLELSGC